jgi:hypothetical protein
MWGNITKHVGNAIQHAKKLQHELESQLDAAVDDKDPGNPGNSGTSVASAIDEKAAKPELIIAKTEKEKQGEKFRSICF